MKKERNTFQIQKKRKKSLQIINLTEINIINLPGKMFKITLIEMLTELWKKKDK